ncbi:hypothetical protein C0995_001209 [Termitomyces sp. Mi166|nr:hypothetical protein C0995_001209 [Termitomyces sp. Mi166\
MADIVEGMQKRRFSASHWCLGRFMQMLIKDRFINYHGQYGARLNFSQSIHSDDLPKRTWFIKIISLLLLSAPNVHLKSLNELWVDQITLKARWVKFFVKMNDQWGEHIVHASILLNANVAFLSIPSNDPSNNAPTLQSARTAAQIASYLSIVSSFASMLLALMLVRKHKAKERESLDVHEYHNYVHVHVTPEHGFETLAIVYSLPYALLTWGMATFLVAFLLMCFVKATTFVRSIVAIATVLILGLILWCVWMFWEETGFHWREILEAVWNWRSKLTSKNGREEGSSMGNQDDRHDETELKHDNAEANENGIDYRHEIRSTEQHVRRGTLHSWMTYVKSWWGGFNAWPEGGARPTKEGNIHLSHAKVLRLLCFKLRSRGHEFFACLLPPMAQPPSPFAFTYLLWMGMDVQLVHALLLSFAVEVVFNEDDDGCHIPFYKILDPDSKDGCDDIAAEEKSFASKKGTFVFLPSLEEAQLAFDDLTKTIEQKDVDTKNLIWIM